LQIGVRRGHVETPGAIVLQRICSAPSLAEVTRTIVVSSCGDFVRRFKSSDSGFPLASGHRSAIQNVRFWQEFRGKSGAGLAVQSQREYNANEAVVATETIT
jgi:hypothetical protein